MSSVTNTLELAKIHKEVPALATTATEQKTEQIAEEILQEALKEEELTRPRKRSNSVCVRRDPPEYMPDGAIYKIPPPLPKRPKGWKPTPK